MAKNEKPCPVLNLFGVSDADAGFSMSGKDESQNWIKDICRKKCPFSKGCIEDYKEYPMCLKSYELINLLEDFRKLVEEQYEHKGG